MTIRKPETVPIRTMIERLDRMIEAQGPDSLWVQLRDTLAQAETDLIVSAGYAAQNSTLEGFIRLEKSKAWREGVLAMSNSSSIFTADALAKNPYAAPSEVND